MAQWGGKANYCPWGGGAGLIPGPAQWVKNLHCCELWCRLAAVALLRPLAWELSYATGASLKEKKKKKRIVYLIVNETQIFLI